MSTLVGDKVVHYLQFCLPSINDLAPLLKHSDRGITIGAEKVSILLYADTIVFIDDMKIIYSLC